MRTYTGTVVRASHDTQTPTVTILMATQPLLGRSGGPVEMHCATRVAVEAACLIGRKVEFQAELSERTHCLTDIKLCVRSEFGLKAVRDFGDGGGHGGQSVTLARPAADTQAMPGGYQPAYTVTTLMPRPSWRR